MRAILPRFARKSARTCRAAPLRPV